LRQQGVKSLRRRRKRVTACSVRCTRKISYPGQRYKPEVVVLSADLTSSTEIDTFRDAYPQSSFQWGLPSRICSHSQVALHVKVLFRLYIHSLCLSTGGHLTNCDVCRVPESAGKDVRIPSGYNDTGRRHTPGY
jgi:hypothetical protein